MKVYFDNAATTPLAPEVIEAMLPFMQTHFGNPSAIHSFGRETRSAIEKARKTIAKHLNCSPGEIFFTSGGTESSNFAIRRGVEASGAKHIITSPIEHHCVLHTVEELEKSGKIKAHYVKVDSRGRFDLNHLEELLKILEAPVFVSLMHANNEIGTMMDIDAVAEICNRYNAVLHTDTVQSMCHHRFDLQKTKVSMLQGSGHKFHGPKGVGFIYISSLIKLHPLLFGGGQERNMRAGTENLYGIIGLAKAMDFAYEHFDENKSKIESLRKYFIVQLKENFSGVTFNGDYDGRYLFTVLNVAFPHNDKSELLLFNLDVAGIAASSGSACSSGSDVGSHVLNAIGVGTDKVCIRFSFSDYNTIAEVDYAISKLKELMPQAVTVTE